MELLFFYPERLRISRRIACALVGLALFFAGAALRGEVIITEFLAENDGGLADVDGDHPDWIELFNNGAGSVDLAGWRLSDNPTVPAKWIFPAVTLASGSRLVVFASEKDRRDPAQELHTNFKLDSGGESVVLSKPDGTVTSRFDYPDQKKNISYGEGTMVAAEELVTSTSTGKILVPANNTLGTSWTSAGFDDAGWTAASSRIGYQAGAAAPGLPIAYWTFDDTTANEIVGRPALTLVGSTYNPVVPGQIGDGKSLHFDRLSGNYATALLDVSETAYTASMWFRSTSNTTGIFAVHGGPLGVRGHDRHIYLLDGNIGMRTYNATAVVSTGKNFADGAWHHVAHVVGVGGQKLYVDGQLLLTSTKAQSDFTTQDTITIGYSNDATGALYHEGEIDDVAIWSDALGAAAIQSLAAGTSPMLVSGFDPYIGTDVEAAARNINATVYARLPFSVNRATPFTQATLRLRYDDGFVAYIDGTEVARRNAPAAPTYNSTATSDRAADAAIAFETIDITASVGLLTNGNHVLAIHALNDAAGSNEFLLNAELSAATLSQQGAIFLEPPTPGQPNGTGFGGYVADTVFLPKRGFFDTAQNVLISTATPGATIAYTIDGTDPSPTNGVQVAPANSTTPPTVALNVADTKAIRAMAYKTGTGLRATNVDSHTYIFPNKVLAQPNNPPGFNPQWSGRAADYGMDQNVVNTTLPGYGVREGLLSLPTISVTCKNSDLFDAPFGIYYNTSLRGAFGEKKVSVEWINPDGTPGWHVQAGARLHGNSSRAHTFTPKHPIRLKFRDEYGDGKFNRDLFGKGAADKFDELILRGCSTDSFPVVDGGASDGEQRWNNDKATYLRDQFIRDTLNALGWPNPHGEYCHLYINGLYWGLYNISERPSAEFFSETFGGEDEEWDVIKDLQEVNDGNRAAWDAMLAITNDGTLTYEERAQKLIGNNPDGTRNPGCEVYLHLPSFIDYMIVHIAAGAEDWPERNLGAGRRWGAGRAGFNFVVWPPEISNDSLTRLSGRGSGNPFGTVGDPAFQNPVDRNGPAGLYDTLRRAPTFQQKFRERIHQLLLNNGPLSPAANKARWAARMAEIDKAVVAESARWGDGNGEGAKKRETTWLNNMAYMMTPKTGYFDAVLPIQIERFRSAGIYPSMNQPLMSQQGGVVPPGYELFFTTDQPYAYYTIDGSDPMDPATGEPSASALPYAGGVYQTDVVPQSGLWHYFVSKNAPLGDWKKVEYDDGFWPEGQAQLGYGDGDEVTVIGDGGNPASRNITTYFRNRFLMDSMPLTATLHLLRDDGAVVYLNGKEVARSNMHPTKPIAWSTTASTNASGVDESSYFYQYTLDPADFVVGENVLAIELHQVSSTSDDLSFDARLEVLTGLPTAGIVLDNSTLVKVRARSFTGEWSGLNSAFFAIGLVPASSSNLAVSELHYHPADPVLPAELAVSADPDDYEFIELMNIGSSGIDCTGVAFTTGVEFHFPAGYVLPPGKRCIVARNAAAFEARYGSGREVAGVFENGTSLSNSGETITLTGGTPAAPVVIRSFTYDDVSPWPVAADGGGPSLVLLNPATNPDHNLPTNWAASPTAGGNPGQAPTISRFAAWRSGFPDELEVGADDDGDGISNVMEFALMSDPLRRDTTVLPTARMSNVSGRNVLTLICRHRKAEPGLQFVIETSGDLRTWAGEPAVILDGLIDHGDGTVTETWRSVAPAADGRAQFMRMRAIVAP